MSVNDEGVNHPVADDDAQVRSEGRAASEPESLAEQSSEASSSESVPRKRFRMRGSKFWLTFAQCETPKELVVAKLTELFPQELEGYVVAEEEHENGAPHLHVYLAFKTARLITDQHYFDTIVTPMKHGNYQVARSPQAVIQYCAKEGVYVAQNVDIRTKSRKRKERTLSQAYFQDVVVENLSKEEADFRYGPYRLLHGRSLDAEVAYQLRLRAKRFRATCVQRRVKAEAGDALSTNEDIATWLNDNIRTELPRDLRQAQLWIVTPPGAGKTTFKDIVLPWLYPGLSVYLLPNDGEWFDDYEDGCYDLIIADEYRRDYTVRQLNRLADGSVIMLRRRGQPPVLKRDNLPMIVLSNFTIDEAYCKLSEQEDESLKALKERFVEVRFNKGQKLRIAKEGGQQPPITLNHPHAMKAGVRSTYGSVPKPGPIPYDLWNGVEDPLREYREEVPLIDLSPPRTSG